MRSMKDRLQQREHGLSCIEIEERARSGKDHGRGAGNCIQTFSEYRRPA
jgi:hypothetical protein